MSIWSEQIPVVIVYRGFGEQEPQTFHGYAASVDSGGALVLSEAEPGFQDGQIRRKPYGHTVVFANGTWERCESEWHPVAEETLTS